VAGTSRQNRILLGIEKDQLGGANSQFAFENSGSSRLMAERRLKFLLFRQTEFF
jgi:hypothetical protein